MFQSRVMAEYFLANVVNYPTDLAPQTLKDAIASASAAYVAELNASDKVDDAEVQIRVARQLYDLQSEQAVRKQEPLPSKDGMETATIRRDILEKDLLTAKIATSTATSQLAQALDVKANRDDWRTAIDNTLTDTLTAYQPIVSQAEQIEHQIIRAVSTTQWLGDWKTYLERPGVDIPPVSGPLRKLAQVKPWTSPQPIAGLEAPTVQEPKTRDNRQPVWSTFLDSDNAVHQVSAAWADIAWANGTARPALPDEIAAAQARQPQAKPDPAGLT